MTRRRFLVAAATASASAAWPQPLAATLERTARRIPIGFLGCTYSHGPDKIRITMSSPDWELVGVCDESEAGRRICAELGAKRISQDELWERAQVVAVESEIRDHAAHGLLALQAGKHIHLEKPPAVRGSDLEALMAVAREKRLLVQAGFMWRYHPGFQAILDAARQGWLGDIFLVRGFISNHLSPSQRKAWAEFEGGSMFELGSHLVDATVRLLGKPKSVIPVLRRHGQFDDSCKDNNVAILEYERATAVLVNTGLQPAATPARSFEVLGTNGTATLQPIEPPSLTLVLKQAAGPYSPGLQEPSLAPYRRYVGDFAELASAVRGECALSVSLEDELLVAQTVLRTGGML